MERGKFVDIGNHEDLLEKHKNYSTILSRKEGNNQEIDLDSTKSISDTGFARKDNENVVQELLHGTKKETSFRNSLFEVGYGSTESLTSTSSICVTQTIDTDHSSEITVTEGIKYFLKVYLIFVHKVNECITLCLILNTFSILIVIY